MRIGSALCCGGVLLLAGCGGGGADAGTPAIAFAGTLSVTSALPVGVTTCQTTSVVTFTAAGADVHTVSLEGGGCIEFVNTDAAPHRPAPLPASPCPELAGPQLPKDGHFITAPLDGPKVCQWQDALRPIPTGGGDGY